MKNKSHNKATGSINSRSTTEGNREVFSQNTHRASESIAATYGSTSATVALAREMEDEDAHRLAIQYASPAERQCARQIGREVSSRVSEAVRHKGCTAIRVSSIALPPSGSRRVDLGAARKIQSRIVRANGDCIAMLRLVAIRDANEAAQFSLQLHCIVLALLNASGGSHSNDGLRERAFADELDAEKIRRQCRAFFQAPRLLQQEADKAACDLDEDAWRQWQALRETALWSATVLTPWKKILVGNGVGREIVAHALTGPEARAKAAKKVGRMTRDDVVDLLWEEAMAKGLPAPVYVRS